MYFVILNFFILTRSGRTLNAARRYEYGSRFSSAPFLNFGIVLMRKCKTGKPMWVRRAGS